MVAYTCEIRASGMVFTT